MNRFYGNSVGRFESTDIAAFRPQMPTTLNRYLYAFDDPINNADTTGLEPCAYTVCVTTPPPPPTGLIDWVFVTINKVVGGGPAKPRITLKEWDDIRGKPKPGCGRLSGLQPDCMSDAEKDVLRQVLNDPSQLQIGVMPFMPSLNSAGGL